MSDSSAVTMESIELDRIRDCGSQMREQMHAETVAEYAEALLDGAVFPPVVLFHDGTDHWLADGFHRLEAHRKIGRKEIAAEVRQGSSRDAILHGIGSNATHGLRRTQVDKRRAVVRLLQDPHWGKWSDRKIGEAARVDHKTVAKIKRELVGGEIPTTPKTTKAPGELPRANGGPNERPSMLSEVLRTAPDAAIVAEVRRRGLTVTP